MNKLLIAGALAATLTGTTVAAAEIGATGISIGGKLDGNYVTGVDTYSIDFIPSAGFEKWGIAFKGETTIDVIELNNGDVFQGIDFDASYNITSGLKAYGEISADQDLEFGDAKVGVSFAF